jgi:uncharacterized protein (TIGR00730 family)
MKRIAIFCGAGSGVDEVYGVQAYLLGKSLAKHGIGIVYGGSKTGLMGKIADGVLDNKGEVTGVIPEFLMTKEIAHENLSELIVVDTMHQRKEKMSLLADAIIALPGGLGTMEELFEILTWRQIGLHFKPIYILNINGYYDHLLLFIEKMKDSGFLKIADGPILSVCESVEELLALCVVGAIA